MNIAPILEWLEDAPIDQRVEQKARLLLLDTLACAVRGLAEPEPAALAREFARVTPGSIRLPGVPAALAATDVAYVLGVAACWHEACDGLASAHGRPGLHAIPVAIALATQLGKSLGDVLTAIVYGYEIGGRLGAALRIRDGMHVDGTWGSLASAAAASRLLSDDRRMIERALAVAACQMPSSLYLPIVEGTTARNTYAAHGATLGMQSALAALSGITGPRDALPEADRLVFSNRRQPLSFTPAFVILDAYIKPFAAVRHVHYGAACALAWREEHPNVALSAIEGLELDTYAEAVTYCGNRSPKNAIQAQFSLSYGTAHALAQGSLTPDAYSSAALADRETARLERLMVVRVDSSLKNRGARLAVITKGRKTSIEVGDILGDPGKPMTVDRVREKARPLLSSRLTPLAAASIIDYILEGDADRPFVLPMP